MLRDLLARVFVSRASSAELVQLAGASAAAGRLDDAIKGYLQAIRRDAANLAAYNGLGLALQRAGRFAESAEWFRRVLAVDPEQAGIRNNLGTSLRLAGDLDGAAEEYERAAALAADDPVTQVNRAVLAQKLGLADEAVGLLRATVQRFPGDATASRALAQALNYSSEFDSPAILAEFRVAGATLSQGRAAPAPAVQRGGRDGPLRIGYLSPDFRNHPVAWFMEPILAAHEPAAVSVTCYDDSAVPDSLTRRLSTLGPAWRRTGGLDEEQAAAVIAQDRLDLLVDLAGLTTGSRPGLLARRPAPVIASYLGYLNTTGLPFVDWRITDRIADPPGVGDAYYSEKLAYLPACQWLFAPVSPGSGAAPVARRPGPVVFGAAHNFAKINAQVLSLWASTVAAVPNARVSLAGVPRGSAEQRVRAAFSAAGVAEERVHCTQGMPRDAYFEFLSTLDIALDTFPYNGGTTTCEALWMGVPVVSLAGRHGSARSGASILHAVGLDDCVAGTRDEYVRIAAGLAGDAAGLAGLRAGLRARMQDSALMDARGFAGALEALFKACCISS